MAGGGSLRKYCIDTSAIGDLEGISESTTYDCTDDERTRIWAAIEDMVREGRLITVHAAREEFKRKCPEAFKRLDPLKFFRQDSIEIWTELTNVFRHSLRWQRISADRTRHTRDKADWFLVALASVEGLTVITTEKHRDDRSPNNKSKDCIPDVCDSMGVHWVYLDKFIEQERLK